MHYTQPLYEQGLVKAGNGNLKRGIRKVARATGFAESYVRRPVNAGEPYETKGVPQALMNAIFNPTTGILFQ